MDELAARERLSADYDVSRETLERIEAFIVFLKEENERQNLASRSSLEQIWNRHILDSAQLLRFSPSKTVNWLDLGTGAGFPGIIVALLHQGQVTLVEERRKRAEFLTQAVDLLGISAKTVIQPTKLERFESRPFDVISARAFAPLDRLFALSHSFSTAKTRFILPKGRNAAAELDAARASWQGEFRIEPSLTDDDAGIVIAEGLKPKTKGVRAR